MVTPEAKPTPQKRYWETSDFWKDAGERIVTAFITGFLGLVTADMLTGPRIDIGLKNALIAGGVAAIISTMKAILGANIKGTTTPVSLT